MRERGPLARAGAVLATALGTLALALVSAVAPAAATTVVNGDFEAGGLQGWQVHQAVGSGGWYAYTGTQTPISEKRGNHSVQPPPQGKRAAISDQLSPETLILYQDVALEPGLPHFLNLFAYYDSARPIAVPSPETLSADDETLAGQANQQFRVEVVKPEAPIDTVEPADILRTAFRTEPGAPRSMKPGTGISVDLSSFAGQTVRIRAAVVAHEELFNAGIDAVSVTRKATPPSTAASDGGGGGHGGDGSPTRLRIGKVKVDRRSGTVALAVAVPGPGLISVRSRPRWAIQHAARKAKGPGTVWMKLRPRGRALRLLARRQVLRAAPSVVFVPAVGEIETVSRALLFRLNKRPR